MKFWESFLLIYLMIFLAGWIMYGLHPNDAYLYINLLVAGTLIIAIIGTCIEHYNKDLKQEEIHWSWEDKNTEWTETEENRTDADRNI